jgi:NitT/TauT family transport system permease protein
MRRGFLYPSVSVIVFVGVWLTVSESGVFSKILLASPFDVFISLVEMVWTGSILPDLIATIFRTVVGLFAGILIGVPLGLFMGYSKRIYDSLEFLVDFFRSIPAAALIPLFMLFLGLGDEAKVALVVFVTSLVILINTMYGVRHSKKIRVMVARTMKLSNYNIFRKVIIPDSLPYISVGVRISISLSLIIVIVTEMIMGAYAGLGRRIIDFHLTYNISGMYAVIILTGIIGYLSNRLYLIFEKRKIHWAEK